MTEVPNLSNADLQSIFKDLDVYFNSILMQAFFQGVNTYSCNFL